MAIHSGIHIRNVRRVASFRVAGVALRDIPACFIMCPKSFCVTRAMLLRSFQKMASIFRGRRNILEISVVILRGRLHTPHSTLHPLHFTLDTLHLHTLHSTLCTPHFTPHLTLSTLHFTLHTLHSALCTLHSTH